MPGRDPASFQQLHDMPAQSKGETNSFRTDRAAARASPYTIGMPAMSTGKFQGVIAATTPTGSCTTRIRLVPARSWVEGSTWPGVPQDVLGRPPKVIAACKGSHAATFVYDATGANPIGYGAGATCGVNGLACFTATPPDGFTMWLREQGHVFDWGTLKWCQAYATPPNGCYDAETITLDEFGHVEGLDHHVNYGNDSDYDDAVVQTFSRTKPNAGWNRHTFGRCDVATLQRPVRHHRIDREVLDLPRPGLPS